MPQWKFVADDLAFGRVVRLTDGVAHTVCARVPAEFGPTLAAGPAFADALGDILRVALGHAEHCLGCNEVARIAHRALCQFESPPRKEPSR